MRKAGRTKYPKIKIEKKQKYICSRCRKELTPETAYFRVDESNCAITNNAPPFCIDCYKIHYGER